MVELDVVEAKDTKPVLFHGPKGDLGRDCGVDAHVHDLASEELAEICFRESNQHIISLADIPGGDYAAWSRMINQIFPRGLLFCNHSHIPQYAP